MKNPSNFINLSFVHHLFLCTLYITTSYIISGCTPRVATSFWRIGTAADSTHSGYAVLHEGKKVRHCYPITEWTDTPDKDTYRQLHHHGVALESEQMAYRIYFDKKQTIDVYCKRKPQLELATSYWYPNDSLLDSGYGDDILRVSGTVGVGSVKYWNGKKHVHIEPVAERTERILRQTRNEAAAEVAVKGWAVEGKTVDMTVQYTIHAGHRDMRCDVFLSEPVNGLCTGVQAIPASVAQPTFKIEELPNGVLLSSWGTDWPVNDTVKYHKETVGLAVFIPKEYAGELVKDKANSLCLLVVNKEKTGSQSGTQAGNYSCHFYLTCVGATKENHPVATNATEWQAYLRRWASTK